MSYQTLLVDDDPVVLFILSKLLKSNDFDSSPKTFQNGDSALNYLKTDNGPKTKYVLFLDINMPIIDGWQFLESLKDFANPKKVLVIMVSSSINPSDIERAENNEFVVKFIAKPILTNTINSLKNLVNSRLTIN